MVSLVEDLRPRLSHVVKHVSHFTSSASDPRTHLLQNSSYPYLSNSNPNHRYSVSLGNVVRGILGDGIASRSGGATPPVVISSSPFPLLLRLLLHSATHHLTSLTITQSSHQIPLSPEGVASTENGAVVLDQLKWGSGDDKSYQWLMSVLSNYSYESYEGMDLVVDDTYVYTFFSPPITCYKTNTFFYSRWQQ